jgi:hypothetical protein
MDASIRAHRTIGHFPKDRWIPGPGDRNEPSGSDLGFLIGSYLNPRPESEIVEVRLYGLSWELEGYTFGLRYEDIDLVELGNAKDSTGLDLTLKDGRKVFLPIRGRDGRMRDCMEFLRFIDRVVTDISESRRKMP